MFTYCKSTFIKFKKYYQRIQKRNTNKYKFCLEEIHKELNIYLNENKVLEDLVMADFIDMDSRDRKSLKELVTNNFVDMENSYPLNQLYIFGHYLDVTDRDVLCELILNENVETNIFYFNKEDYEKKLINIVKLIGQKKLIKRYGKTRGSIKFIKQANMVRL